MKLSVQELRNRQDSRNKRSILLLCLSFAALASCADAAPLEGNVQQKDLSGQNGQTVYRHTAMTGSLESSLNHPQRLNAVMSQFSIGGDFMEVDRAKFNCRAQWFRLPEWLAGKWHCEEPDDDIRTHNFQDQTSISELAIRQDEERTVVMGHQRDLTKQIWHFICVPFVAFSTFQITAGKNETTVLVPLEVSMQQFPDATPWRVVLNERFMALKLKPKPDPAVKPGASTDPVVVDVNEIANVTQHDIVITYSYTSKTSIGIVASEEVYDAKGLPMQSISTTHTYKKETDFTTTNKIEEVDLFASFKGFLQGNGMSDRVPKDSN